MAFGLSRERERQDRTSWLLVYGTAMTLGLSGCAAEPTPEGRSDNDQTVEEAADDQAEKPKGKSDAGAKPARDAAAVVEEEVDDEPPPAPVDDGKSTSSNDAVGGAASWCTVKPLVDKYCIACHDGAGTGPMALNTALDFAADSPVTKGKKVYETVRARLHDPAKPMPPPPKKLTAEELALLDSWLDLKAPAGTDATCESSKPAVDPNGKVDGWNPEECDEIYEVRSHGPGGLKDPYMVPPGGEIHPQIKVDAPWGNEKVQAIGFKPLTDNKAVLHHWILNGFGRSFLAGWAPGDEARPPFPADVGMDMPSGPGAFTLDMHYYNLQGTTTQPDNSGVAICVLKEGNFRKNLAAVTGSFSSIGSGGVLAPRNSVNKPVTSVCNVTVTGSGPVHLLTAAPHAHKYASHMKFTVKKKDGTEIVMHDQPWVYGEQGTYPVPGGEVLIETGDQVITTCSYTNDTSRDIRFGESTEDEMCFNFALYYPKGGFSCGGGVGAGFGAFGGGR